MMILMTIAFTICTGQLINSLTLDLNKICSCSQLIYMYDCLESSFGCAWDTKNKTCSDAECSEIKREKGCISQSRRCYWGYNKCFDLIQCDQISGYSQEECMSKNMFCPAQNMSQCLPMEDLDSCQNIENPSKCEAYYSLDGPCMWNGTQCILLETCKQLWTNETQSCSRQGCYFDQSTETCLDMTCSKLVSRSKCLNGVQRIGPYLNNILSCIWDTEKNICKESSPKEFTIEQCMSFSHGTYRWSQNTITKGKCSPCYNSILSTIIGLLIVILL